MTIITDERLKLMYEVKKASCAKRLIPFKLSIEQWIALYRARSTLTCFYTDNKFDLRKTSGDNYPTLERICEVRSYEESNLVFASNLANKLKASYIESDRSCKGLGDKKIKIIQRIKKVMKNPEMMEQRLAPYTELFSKVAERQQELIDKDLREKQRRCEAAERAVKLEQAKVQEEEQNAAKALEARMKARFDKQLEIAEHYTQTYKMFSEISTYQLTIKEHRDMIRRNSCALSGEKFNTVSEKYIWVVDKSLPLTKDNLKVCLKKYADCIDFLAKGDNIKLKTVMLNTLKFI